MESVSIRELRNHGGDVVDRVAAGEHVTITRDGLPVAELRAVGRQVLSAATLLERWRLVPRIDAAGFRRDVDRKVDPGL